MEVFELGKKLKVTLSDVALESKVSITTISQVLNNVSNSRISNATKEKVIKAANKLGYQPDRIARSLAIGKTNIIGLAISGFTSPTFSTPFFSELIRGIGGELEKRNYDLLMLYPKRDSNPDKFYQNTIGTGLLDGIILEGSFIRDEFIIKLHNEGFPYILIGRELQKKKIRCVLSDYFNGAYLATKHLIKIGHRRVAFIDGPKGNRRSNIRDRRKGYVHALKEYGIEPISELMIYSDNISQSTGYKCMKKLLSACLKFTAVFTAHDLLAIGAMKAIKENGLKIPDDIAVVGFSDLPEALMVRPRLTTVRHNLLEIGEAAASLLIQAINGIDNKRKQLFPTRLIIRESSGGGSNYQ
jgi:DNA-binding LacI/PurR family transcriptional regulator